MKLIIKNNNYKHKFKYKSKVDLFDNLLYINSMMKYNVPLLQEHAFDNTYNNLEGVFNVLMNIYTICTNKGVKSTLYAPNKRELKLNNKLILIKDDTTIELTIKNNLFEYFQNDKDYVKILHAYLDNIVKRYTTNIHNFKNKMIPSKDLSNAKCLLWEVVKFNKLTSHSIESALQFEEYLRYQTKLNLIND